MEFRKVLSTVLLLLLVAGLTVNAAYAGSESRQGTAGATELLIPLGSRGTALAGSVNSVVSGAEAIYWNPAGMSRTKGSVEAMFSNLNYLADIKVNYFAVVTNLGDIGSLGLSLRSMSFGDIEVTTTDNPEGTGATFSPTYITAGLTFSRAFTDRIYGGFTAKLITESIVRTSASGVAFDFGVQYISGESGLRLGVVLKNLGPKMSYDGPDLEYFSSIPGQEVGSRARAVRLPGAGFELPSTLEIGIGYEYPLAEQHKIGLSGNFENANFGSDMYRLGLEYVWNDRLFLRGGYRVAQNQADNIYGPTFGAGVMLPVETSFVSFDYAYRKTDFFDASHWLTLKFGF